jgi:hypothetical protein
MSVFRSYGNGPKGKEGKPKALPRGSAAIVMARLEADSLPNYHEVTFSGCLAVAFEQFRMDPVQPVNAALGEDPAEVQPSAVWGCCLRRRWKPLKRVRSGRSGRSFRPPAP